MNLFVDDLRNAPSGWTLARTYADAVEKIRAGNVKALSIDYDLKTSPGKSGLDVVRTYKQLVKSGKVPAPSRIVIHSSNIRGANKIHSVCNDFCDNVKKRALPYPKEKEKSLNLGAASFIATLIKTGQYVLESNEESEDPRGELLPIYNPIILENGIPKVARNYLIEMIQQSAGFGDFTISYKIGLLLQDLDREIIDRAANLRSPELERVNAHIEDLSEEDKKKWARSYARAFGLIGNSELSILSANAYNKNKK